MKEGPVNETLLTAANILTAGDALLALERRGRDQAAAAELDMVRLQLAHVLHQVRTLAGLNPDGTFDAVPRPRLPKRGSR